MNEVITIYYAHNIVHQIYNKIYNFFPSNRRDDYLKFFPVKMMYLPNSLYAKRTMNLLVCNVFINFYGSPSKTIIGRK